MATGGHRRRCAPGARLARGAIAVVGVAGLGAGGAWMWGELQLGDPARPALAERAVVAPTTTTTSEPRCRAALTPDSPLRLWIGGDSLAGSLGPSLGEQTAATGIVLPTFDSRVSSGLASPSFFDWPEHATEEMARLNPEVVVFIIGANDYSVARAQPLDSSGQPAWRAQYAQLVEEMLGIFETQDRAVYWVGAPVMQDRRKEAGVQQVNAVAREVVARHPSATYVDSHDQFSTPDGRYTATLPGPGGTSIRTRASDGIHFTAEGGDLLAVQVFAQLDARCSLVRQAVTDRPQPVLRTKGSSQVPGTHRDLPSTPPSAPAPSLVTTTSTVPDSTTTTSTNPTPPTPTPTP